MINTTKLHATLTAWQARQAAMLYHYSSLDYLKKLHQLVHNFATGVVDPLLTLAQQQGRDSVITDSRWGTRNTSDNWANNAWPILKDLDARLAKDIAFRSFEKYKTTAVNECLRGIEQFSTNWATEEEEREFQNIVSKINLYASRIDSTFEPRTPHWDDYAFAYEFPSFVVESPRIPEFKIRTDLTAQSGQLPPRTGVYIAADDPNASLQFAALGSEGLCLRNASTFNEIGLAALAAVGRHSLWFDEKMMLNFARASPKSRSFMEHVHFFGRDEPALAPSAVARYSFTDHPSKWYFVEKVQDDFEDASIQRYVPGTSDHIIRLASGAKCEEPGFYFSPAGPGSRRFFNTGETMPTLGSDYGETVWQWDPRQNSNNHD